MKVNRKKIIICKSRGNKTNIPNEALETSPNDKYYTYSSNTELDWCLYGIGIIIIVTEVFSKGYSIPSKIYSLLFAISLFKIVYEVIRNIFQLKINILWFRILTPILIDVIWYLIKNM